MNIIRLAPLALVALLAVSPAHAWQVKKDGATQLKLTDSGNLGIGTTSPQSTLHVASTSNSIVRLDSGTNFASVIVHYNGETVGSGLGLFPASDTRAFMLYNSTANNSTPIMTGLQSGNVGIGTTTPTAKLEVAGQVKITGGSPGMGKVLTSDAAGLASWQTPSGGGSGAVIGGRDVDGILWGTGNGRWGQMSCSSGTPRCMSRNGDGQCVSYLCIQ